MNADAKRYLLRLLVVGGGGGWAFTVLVLSRNVEETPLGSHGGDNLSKIPMKLCLAQQPTERGKSARDIIGQLLVTRVLRLAGLSKEVSR